MKNILQAFSGLMILTVLSHAFANAIPNEVAPVLHKGGGGRAMAMAECFAAIGEGPFGLNYNPAALAIGNGVMVGFQHESTNYETEHEAVAGRFGLGPGSLGVMVNFYQYGTVENRDLSGQLTGELSKLQEVTLLAGYGLKVHPDWNLGLNAKMYGVELGETTIKGLVFDLGALVDVGQGFTVAGVIKSVGSKYEGYDMPSLLRLGTAYRTFANTLIVDAELDISFADVPADFGLGAEYQILPWLDGRLGFKTSLENNNNAKLTTTAGIGFNFGGFGLDLNFANRSVFGNEFGVAMIYQFGEPRHQVHEKAVPAKKQSAVEATQDAQIEKLKKIKASARPIQEVHQAREDNYQKQKQDQAAYHLEAGQEYEKYGQLIDAIIEYKAALKIRPAYQPAQQALASARLKAKARERKSPPHQAKPVSKQSSLQKLIRKYYEKGQTAYNQKDYSEAIKQLQLVLEMTDKHRQATTLLKKAKVALTDEMSSLKRQAEKAQGRQDLPAEVEAYQKMLDLDPKNKKIKNKLTTVKKKIPQEVERLYKMGLDYYAKQQFRKALHAFEDVLKMQPNHVKAKDAVASIKEKLVQTGQ